MKVKGNRRRVTALGWTLCLVAGQVACAGRQAEKRAPAVPVAVATAAQKDMPLQINAIGNVEAITSVQVKSMINGEITAVKFKEGQDVAKGDLLFTIDASPYEADLRNKEATLARDIATTENARAEARRYQALWKEGVVASQQAEDMQAAADAGDALVRADRAAVENAKVQLQYTRIYSPIRGRTGSLTIQLGNVIKANDLPLLSINQIDPIYVTFAIPEQQLGNVKRYLAQHSLKVTAKLSGEPQPAEGTLTFIDNEVDRQTGTIKLKGTFANRDHRLWPGQFVDVTLVLAVQPKAVVIPAQAVQEGQQGQFVFVIDKEMKAQARLVSISQTLAGQSVVATGIAPGEVVVTDGQIRLNPGAKVEFINP
jgi:multidrug efflux system membrane fusion protein